MIRMYFRTAGVFFRKVFVKIDQIPRFRYRSSGSLALSGVLVCTLNTVSATQASINAAMSAAVTPGAVTAVLNGVMSCALTTTGVSGTSILSAVALSDAHTGTTGAATATLNGAHSLVFEDPHGSVHNTLNGVMTVAAGNVGVASFTASINAVQLAGLNLTSTATSTISGVLSVNFGITAASQLGGALLCSLSSAAGQTTLGANFASLLSPVATQTVALNALLVSDHTSSGKGSSTLQAVLFNDTLIDLPGQDLSFGSVLQTVIAADVPPVTELDSVLTVGLVVAGTGGVSTFNGQMNLVMTNPGVHSSDTSVFIVERLG